MLETLIASALAAHLFSHAAPVPIAPPADPYASIADIVYTADEVTTMLEVIAAKEVCGLSMPTADIGEANRASMIQYGNPVRALNEMNKVLSDTIKNFASISKENQTAYCAVIKLIPF